MHAYEDFYQEEDPPKRRVGRPKGSRNKPKDTFLTQDKLESLYKRVEPMLDPEHRVYLHGVVTGKIKIDPLAQAAILLRYFAILSTEAMEWALQEKKITQDLAKFVGEYRMAIKDYEDMQRRREELKLKRGDDERVVNPSRESALARFAEVGAIPSEEGRG